MASVHLQSITGFAQRIQARSHQLQADEPLSNGGTDSGPAPYELLLAGLAACTSLTLRMYADRKQWPLEKIRVEVTSEKIDKTTIFIRHVYFEGALDDEQRNRLLQIANACPVHKALTNPIEIKTELR